MKFVKKMERPASEARTPPCLPCTIAVHGLPVDRQFVIWDFAASLSKIGEI